MNDQKTYILKSLTQNIYVRKIMPSDYLFTPFRWGNADEAISFTKEHAEHVRQLSIKRHVRVVLIPTPSEEAGNPA
jgi:hypothetical protein